MNPQDQRPIIVVKEKSVGLALILAILFGGLGLLYASVLGGIIMLCVEFVVFVLGLLTLGFLMPLLILVHIISCIWAVVAVQRYNKKISNQYTY
ncbi:hypothetical protein [Thermoflavimicrobium dichotomicum]|uniref:Uncharacterized protein n=1 Tax=Thermoflavimicrobium dichotomicum TaxID=46223 RepID=A0A1I3VHZ8_9BACL|nr:hypothetical protein [Thermoflavimicrobium dichotomicum]SFJ93867.1 hypothetical protein SAMN05421852_1472 [Thermoflavimicrobium dichotomicum]